MNNIINILWKFLFSLFIVGVYIFIKESLKPYSQEITDIIKKTINSSGREAIIILGITLLVGFVGKFLIKEFQRSHNSWQYFDSLSHIKDKIQPKRLIDDIPISDFAQLKFNRKEYVHEITEIIESIRKRKERKSIKIAVFGEWGTGKSSIMKPVNNLFSQSSVWFDAWQHQNEDSLVEPLLLSIFDKSEEDNSLEVFINKFCCTKSNLLKRILLTDPSAEFNIGIIKQKIPIKEILNDQREELLLTKVRLREIFKELKNRFIHQDFPMIIFIDNLDRVDSSKAVDFLDSMHILSEINEKVIFIFGLDHSKIYEGVVKKYSKEEINVNYSQHNKLNKILKIKRERLFNDYIDKIFDLKYELPPIDPDAFITEYLDTKARELKCNKPNIISSLISIGTDNPRRAIRIFNQFILTEDYVKAVIGELFEQLINKPEIICKLTVLKECFPKTYQLLIDSQNKFITLETKVVIQQNSNSITSEISTKENKNKIELLISTGELFSNLDNDLFRLLLNTIHPLPLTIENTEDFHNVLQSNNSDKINTAKQKAKKNLSILNRRKLTSEYINNLKKTIA